MAAPRWDELSARWAEDDGALVDVYVENTTFEDWQLVIDAIRRRWPSTYAEAGATVAMPSDVRAVFARRSETNCLWQVELAASAHANCHFTVPEEIEFDLSPREMRSQTDLDAACDLALLVGRSLAKRVHLCIEGRAPDDLRYEPDADAIIVMPPR